MNKKTLGKTLFVLSLVVIIINPSFTFTGHVIFGKEIILEDIFFLIGIALFFISSFLMTSKIKLDAILIPGSVQTKKSQRRADKAAKVFEKYQPSFIIASGGNTPGLDPKYKHEAEIIYRELRKNGIKPKDIRIEASAQNTLENILNCFKKIDGKKVGIVSSPGQLKRINYIIDQAKEEGYIEKDIKIENIETEEGMGDKIYEAIGGIVDRYSLRKGIKNFKSPATKIKEIVNYFVKKFS